MTMAVRTTTSVSYRVGPAHRGLLRAEGAGPPHTLTEFAPARQGGSALDGAELLLDLLVPAAAALGQLPGLAEGQARVGERQAVDRLIGVLVERVAAFGQADRD